MCALARDGARRENSAERVSIPSTRSSDGQRELTLIGIDAWIYSRPGGEYSRIVFEGPTRPRGTAHRQARERRGTRWKQRPPCLRVARYALLQPAISSLSVTSPYVVRSWMCERTGVPSGPRDVDPFRSLLRGRDDDRDVDQLKAIESHVASFFFLFFSPLRS